jgi:hypothetical protein
MMNHSIADFYYDKKKFSDAKIFYIQSLEKPTSVRFWDVERLVRILVEEKNFTEAETYLNKYINPGFEKEIYTKISGIITNAATKN